MGALSAKAGCLLAAWLTHLKKIQVLLVPVLCAFVLTGCDTWSDDDDPPAENSDSLLISGTAQKGLFDNLIVTATPVNAATGELGDAAEVVVTDQLFTVEVPNNQLTLLQASGTFINEVSGELIELDEPLEALVAPTDADLTVNINLITTLVSRLALRDLPQSPIAPAQLIEQQAEFINAVVGFPLGTDPALLDFNAITESSDLADPNLQLLILSAGIADMIRTPEPIESIATGLIADGTPFDAELELLAASVFTDEDPLPDDDDNGTLFGGGFGAIADAIMAATSVPEATAALNVLNGLAAAPLYEKVRLYSGLELPDLLNPGITAASASAGGPLQVTPSALFPGPPLTQNPLLQCLPDCEFIPQPTPTVSVSGVTVWEASSEARFYIRLGQTSAQPVLVTIRAESATATAGEDFIGLEQNLVIPAGTISVAVDVHILVDALAESTETIALTLESRTPAYPVLNGSALISVRDGAPANLQDQDAAGMRILLVRLPNVCNPVVNMDGGDCTTTAGQEHHLPLVNGRNTMGVAALDLAAECAATGVCLQQRTDWQADFYLVAKNSLGVQAEVLLGPYLYKRASVQRVGQSASYRYPFIRLDSAATTSLFNNAYANSWDLELEARIGTEPDEVRLARVLPPVIPVPATVQVGETILELGAVNGLFPGSDFGCQVGQYALDAQYYDGGIPMGDGVICVDLDPANPGSPAVMTEGRLDLPLAFLPLENGLGARMTFGGNVSPAIPMLPIGLDYLASLMNLPPEAMQLELFLEGWPFSFVVNSAALTAAGIAIGYRDMKFLRDVGYAANDPRRGSTLQSNDIYYRGVTGQSGEVIIGPNGISTDFTVGGGPASSAHTAFPKARVEWQAFDQRLVNNEIQPTTVALNYFIMRQSTACSGPGCSGAPVDVYNVSAAGVVLDGHGYVLGNAVNKATDQVPGWGKRADGSLAWSRPDDLTAQQNMKLSAAGYRVPATMRVSDYLVAHLNEAGADQNLAVYPLGSEDFVDGNFHPVGLSLGPEKYRDGAGQPVKGDGQDLSAFGSRLKIFNGKDPAFSLASSVAVKYVIRNGGITGVFNVSSADLGPGSAAQFYGYPLDLSRFAVRATDNELDTYTWIDGHLALKDDAGGPGKDFELWFTNLEIDCSARLGKVDVLHEQCDGQDNNSNGTDDENCEHRLFAWKADTDIFAAGFRGDATGQACAVDTQNFVLQHQMHFKALNKPVAFETDWGPTGKLLADKGGQLPTYRFDRSEEGKGFPVNTSAAKLDVKQVSGDSYGYLTFADTKVGVPFWNAIEADLRIANANQFGELVAEPTVMTAKDTLAGLEQAQANKALVLEILDKGKADEKNNFADKFDIRARYEWGRTGFGFELPVYYQPWQLDSGRNDVDAHGRQSRFVGRQLSRDLFVMEANAGINFIEPERTKLSFGASADFEKLGNLSFQIDLTDPDSAAAVDKALMKFGVTKGPLLEPALTDFLDTINIVNRYASRGLDEVMQEGLELSLLEIGKAAAPITPNGQDPFVTVSELLSQVKSVPQQLMAVVSDELRSPLNKQLFALEQDVRDQLQLVETAIADLPPAADDDDIDAVFAELDQLLVLLDQVISQAEAVDGQVDDAIGRAMGLRYEAGVYLSELDQATYDIDLVLRQSVSFVNTVCDADQFDIDTEGNGFLDKAAVRFMAVRRVADILRNSGQLFDAAASLTQDTDAKQRLNTAQRRISEATEELVGFVDEADKAVRSLVCHPEEIDDVVKKALTLTKQIRTDTAKIGLAFDAAVSPLVALQELHKELADGVIRPARDIKEALRLARINVEEVMAQGVVGGDTIVWAIDCVLLEATTRLKCPDSAGLPPMPPVFEDGYGINALVASTDNERDLAGLVFGKVRGGVDDLFKTAEQAVLTETNKLLPGAYFTPEQLRRLLATEIMASAPVKKLRMEMDQHFGEIGRSMNSVVLQFVDQINLVVETALSAVTGPINDALKEALAGVRGLPLASAEINGFATIAGNELERAHIEAGWTLRGSDDDDKTGFKAALDAESWSARNIPADINTPTSCAVEDAGALLDVKISAYGLPINVLAADIEIEKLYLGFTLEQNSGSGPPLIPIGVFGGINTMGEIGFTDAIVFDPAFAAGIGTLQTYVGASAGASFSTMAAEVAFLVGRVCPGNTVLSDLDPAVERFLPAIPPSGFTGAYLRGGATIPIIPGGCALNVGVTADFGTWIFVGNPTTIGGLVGGGAVGQIACIASLRGQVRVGGNVSTAGDLKLTGEAWGVAGVGLCEPGTWTSVPRSREDGFCGTGDAQFNAGFDNGKWDISPPKVSAIH